MFKTDQNDMTRHVVQFCLSIAGLSKRAALAVAAVLPLQSAQAQSSTAEDLRLTLLEIGEVSIPRLDLSWPAAVAAMLTVLAAAAVAVIHLRERRLWKQHEAAQEARIGLLEAERDKAILTAGLERHVTIQWQGRDAEPVIEGDVAIVLETPAPRRILGFGSWMASDAAKRLDEKLEALRQRGQSFTDTVLAHNGNLIELRGHTNGRMAILALREVTGDRKALQVLQIEHDALARSVASMRSLLDAAPIPLWLRDADDAITFANRAYSEAVEAKSGEDVVGRAIELIERPARAAALGARRQGQVYDERVQTVIAGRRKPVRVIEVPTASGAAGVAIDLGEFEKVSDALRAEVVALTDLVDRMPNAIATFDRDRRLMYHNAAYRQLWKLDADWLGSRPSESDILERLRLQRFLPQQIDFRAWREKWFEGYRATEPHEHLWALPDQRKLVVYAAPNPQGGLTYVFEDATERTSLATNMERLRLLQGETLDSLRDGVAVFAANGRLSLFNPRFAALWSIDPIQLKADLHIEQLVALSREPEAAALWTDLRSMVTSAQESRQNRLWRIGLEGGIKIDATSTPLPDGGTLLTFADVTANARAETALRERNEALVGLNRFRTAFVGNVSFALREQLTNVLGFGEALASGSFGPLSERQTSYTIDIVQSAQGMLDLIGDIKDMSDLETGLTELDRAPTRLSGVLDAAMAQAEPLASKHGITIHRLGGPIAGEIAADRSRLEQAFLHLFTSAIQASQAGQSIEVASESDGKTAEIRITDRGGYTLRGMRDGTLANAVAERPWNLHLAFAKTMIERHDGAFEVTGLADGGMAVTCRFGQRLVPVQLSLEA
jgi:signal transduction histidine kinase